MYLGFISKRSYCVYFQINYQQGKKDNSSHVNLVLDSWNLTWFFHWLYPVLAITLQRTLVSLWPCQKQTKNKSLIVMHWTDWKLILEITWLVFNEITFLSACSIHTLIAISFLQEGKIRRYHSKPLRLYYKGILSGGPTRHHL